MELETYLRHFIEGYLLEDLKSMAVIEMAPKSMGRSVTRW